MRSLGLRALLMSISLCALVLVLGLFRSSLFVVLWVFWVPGMAAVAYPMGIRRFDPALHPLSGWFIVLAEVLFWWLVIYVLLRLWRKWRRQSA